jgi:rhomboid protease GluP
MTDEAAPSLTPGESLPLLERLCRLLAAEKGYAILGLEEDGVRRAHGVPPDGFPWRVSVVPELAPLARHFDRVLVRTDGMTFEAICIRDRLAAAAASYVAGLGPLLEAGKGCLAYTGTVQRQKMPVLIQVWELCEAGADVAHLRALRAGPFGTKVHVSAWSVCPAAGTVWTNARLGGLFYGSRGLRALVARAASGEVMGSALPGPVGTGRRPLVTYALAAALAIVFGLELLVGERDGFLSPSTVALVNLGALFRPALSDPAEWYRLIAAGLLHGGPVHLALNLVALLLGGRFLEPLVGRAWFLVMFTVSLLGGSLASLVLNGPETVAVGASGAIMGLLAAAFVLTFRLPHGARRTQAQLGLIYWLVPALIPLARAGGPRVDFGAHLGGALVGFALGGAILGRWRRDASLPPGRTLSRALATACALLLAAGAGRAASQERAQARLARLGDLALAPPAALKELGALSGPPAALATRGLLERFPRDPRVRFMSALVAVEAGDPGRAEAELRAALAERELLDGYFADGRLEAALRAHLAAMLVARGAEGEAREALRPSCARAAEVAPGVLAPGTLARLCAN